MEITIPILWGYGEDEKTYNYKTHNNIIGTQEQVAAALPRPPPSSPLAPCLPANLLVRRVLEEEMRRQERNRSLEKLVVESCCWILR